MSKRIKRRNPSQSPRELPKRQNTDDSVSLPRNLNPVALTQQEFANLSLHDLIKKFNEFVGLENVNNSGILTMKQNCVNISGNDVYIQSDGRVVDSKYGQTIIQVSCQSPKPESIDEHRESLNLAKQWVDRFIEIVSNLPESLTIKDIIQMWQSLPWESWLIRLGKRKITGLSLVFIFKNEKKVINLQFGNSGVYLMGTRMPAPFLGKEIQPLALMAGCSIPEKLENERISICLPRPEGVSNVAHIIRSSVRVSESQFKEGMRLAIINGNTQGNLDKIITNVVFNAEHLCAWMVMTSVGRQNLSDFLKDFTDKIFRQSLIATQMRGKNTRILDTFVIAIDL